MRIRGGLCLFLFWMPAAAHEPAILPVTLTLKVDAGSLRARVEGHPEYWLENVLRAQEPPAEWSGALVAAAKAYIDRHLILRADGKILDSRLNSAAYVHNPWESEEGGQVVFDLSYALPPRAAALAGRAVFYDEEWRAHEAKGEKLYGLPRDYRTFVRVQGPQETRLDVPIGKPDFIVSLSLARRTRTQALLESARLGLTRGGPAAAAFAGALALGGVEGAALMGAIFYAACLLAAWAPGMFLAGPFDWSWAAVAAACAGIGFAAPVARAGRWIGAALAAFAARQAAERGGAGTGFYAISFSTFFLGRLAIFVGWTLLFAWALKAYEKSLISVSEALAPGWMRARRRRIQIGLTTAAIFLALRGVWAGG